MNLGRCNSSDMIVAEKDVTTCRSVFSDIIEQISGNYKTLGR